MKPRFPFLLLVLMLGQLCSCSYAKYLPQNDEIDVNVYGGFIEVRMSRTQRVEGELIAMDSATFFILTETGELTSVIINEAENYKLLYAIPKNYSWTIPAFTLTTITHGWFAISTAPLNIIVTSIIAAKARTAYRYDKRDVSIETLKMFARYPQGIPPDVPMDSIR